MGKRSETVTADIAELRRRYVEISDISSACAVLGWDQATYMPRGGAQARGRQVALLSRLAHQRGTDPALGELLNRLGKTIEDLDPDSDDARLVRVAQRDFEKAVKLPEAFVEERSEASSASYDAWTRARPANDFAGMVPHLERLLDLSRRGADYYRPYAHVADPLIDAADEGLTTASVKALFDALRAELVPIVRAITAQPLADDSCLKRTCPEPAQLAFSLDLAQRFGYDLERGRLDKTHHPFCTRFGAGDVRITTRVREDDISDALFSTLHEAGHALYEQGVAPAFDATPLGGGVSAGVHESQSRLWENIVGRSLPFWDFAFPELKTAFPGTFDDVPLDAFYRAINKVERTLIRTDADEVTYNLHVMLRFDLELDLLEGRLAVKDLPEAWRARFLEDLGIAPPDDRDGCLQDVHWYVGGIGGNFQGYTVGNILSAQIFEAALAAQPGIREDIRAGQFTALHAWLRENVYRHGRKFSPQDLIAKATGTPLTTAPYLRYLRDKYGKLYDLPAA